MTLTESAKDLRTRIWRTSGARFHCYRRMKNRNTLSTITISSLSVYLIAIAVYQKLYSVSEVHPEFDNHLTFVSIIGAVAIIVLSLVEWASEFSVNAMRLLDNATEIRRLQHRIERALIDGTSDAALRSEIETISKEYDQLTDRKSPNHDPIDDLLFRAQNESEPSSAFRMNWVKRLGVKLWWPTFSYGHYLAAIASPIVIVAWLKVC